MKTFSKWTTAEVVEEFKLHKDLDNRCLKAWTTTDIRPTDFEIQLLNHLQMRLHDRVYAWSERELAANLIDPILSVIDFNQDLYHAFWERELSVSYKDERLYGFVDLVVANGEFVPKHPYFLIQEFKKEVEASNDPLGQLLIAMVVAQMLNEGTHPIYGAYVRGRYWHFVLLEGSTYAVHAGFNALTEDIQKILGVLKNTKSVVDELAEIHSGAE